MAKVNKNFELANDSLTSSTLSNEKGIEVVKNVSDFYKAVPVTTSVNVAEIFDKRHDHVLRSIENLISPKMGRLNKEINNWFIRGEYTDSRGRKQTQYLMTRDGFTLLTMGFIG